ncbi:hypothetical protein KC333_g165 [Hortaea werneckii]|nr:hypothetical protein KC333_g165 [Hortaea werneckii]
MQPPARIHPFGVPSDSADESSLARSFLVVLLALLRFPAIYVRQPCLAIRFQLRGIRHHGRKFGCAVIALVFLRRATLSSGSDCYRDPFADEANEIWNRMILSGAGWGDLERDGLYSRSLRDLWLRSRRSSSWRDLV